jgi:glycosyltransferase involved in cell wall biosynthesis
LLERYRLQSADAWLRARIQMHSYRWVVIEELALARYGELCRSLGCWVVFDAHNIEGSLRAELASADGGKGAGWFQRAKSGVLASRLSHEEQRAVRSADLVWACSPMDADDLAALYGKRATVVPNAVDVDAYRPRPAAGAGDWPARPLTLLFTGSFSYYPNAEAAMRLIREILPIVRRSHPTARLCLVGRNPCAAMLAAAKADPAILVTGAVASVLPYFHAESVAVVPLTFGSGTRLKILEAFAAGIPVVSTAKGAEGIDAKDGYHLLLREDPNAIASAAVQLWEDAALRLRIVVNAGLLVESKYSWAVAAARIASSLGVAARDGDEAAMGAHRQASS